MSENAEPQAAAEGAGAQPADSQGGALHDEAKHQHEPGTQDEPVMDMHETNDEERIAGIVAQTRIDVGGADESRIADVLRQRFTETGTRVAEDRIAALAAEVARG